METKVQVSTESDGVLGSVADGVGTITLNRPTRRNAISTLMIAGLAELLQRMAASDDVGAVVITGAGGTFCAGGDVKDFHAQGGEGGGASEVSQERVEQQRHEQRTTVGVIHHFPKPIVAAVPGAAAGAGLGIALSCDLRMGTPSTIMTTAFGRVGLSGDYGTAWLLDRLVGPARAREFMFLSERVDANRCLELGLLNWVVPENELATRAAAVASRLAHGPRLALAHMRQNLVQAAEIDLLTSMDREIPLHQLCGISDDHVSALSAFMEKREPVFGTQAAQPTSGQPVDAMSARP